MKRKLILVAAALLLAFAPAAPAKSEITGIEIIFVKADANGDLLLSKGEVLLIAITQFEEADSDRDGKLEKEEAGDLAKDAEFSDNDSDKDGALSLEEVIEEKLADFDAADADKDGWLTIEEVVKFYESRQ